MKILFISHDASRTGAPIILLNIIQYLKQNTDFEVTILLRESGMLENEFRKLGKTFVLYKPFKKQTFIQRIIYKLFYEKIFCPLRCLTIKNQLRISTFEVIYSNTFANGDVLGLLKPIKIKVITHVHELENTIKSYEVVNLQQIKKFTDKYIAVSDAVKTALVSHFKIDAKNIETVFGFVPNINITNINPKTYIKELLNISQNATVIGGSGNTDWRKGADLFIQVAASTFKKNPSNEIYFIWVGNNAGWLHEFYNKLIYDLNKINILDKIIFTGLIDNPQDYYNIFDIFILPSREDPFPLVCLENAQLGKPIICFDGAGGMPEFVQDDCGFVVPYLDIENMSQKILELIDNPALRKTLGENAKGKVKKWANIETNAQKIVDIIENLIKS